MPETLDSLLHAYLDGALKGPALAALEKRLASPKAAARLEQLKALRGLIGAAAPVPTANQSKAMWNAIKARAAAQAPIVAREPWYAFLTKPWIQGMSVGLVGAAAALVVVFMHPWQARVTELAQAPVLAQAPARASAPAVLAAVTAPAVAPVAAPARAADKAMEASVPAAAPVVVRASTEKTEVERALADNQVDDLIDAFLKARRQQGGPTLGVLPSAQRNVSAYHQGGGATLASYGGAAVPADAESIDPKIMGAVQGGPDENGFWDWHPAAVALNQRDWTQARAELESASTRAGEPVERAFASSALTLLAAPGGPLEGTQPLLPATGDLRVLGSGRWQLQVDNRLARFSQGVSARLPGFRVEGDSLLLDLTFDRGTFSPGTRFTRVAGETPAKVLDAAAQAVDSAEFSAPAGAVYNVHDRELRLR